MNEAAERRTQSVLEALALSGMSDSATVVLIGSSARGTTHARSDVDILIIHEGDCRIRLDRPGRYTLAAGQSFEVPEKA